MILFFSLTQLPFLGLFSPLWPVPVSSPALYFRLANVKCQHAFLHDDHLFFFFLLCGSEIIRSRQSRACRFIQDVGRRLERKWNPRFAHSPINFEWFNALVTTSVSLLCGASNNKLATTLPRWNESRFSLLYCVHVTIMRIPRVSQVASTKLYTQRNSRLHAAVAQYITRRTRQFPIYFKSPALLIRVYANVLSYNTR